jgi:hypothetical protein
MCSNYHTCHSRFHIKLTRLAHPTCKLGPRSSKNLQSAFRHHTYLSRGVTKSYRTHAHGLSKSSTAKMKDTIRNAWHTNTLNKYGSGVEHFIAFCDRENIPAHLRLPASEHLLCAFAASSAGHRAGDTISSDLSAVRAWHIINNAPYMGGLQLKYTIKGARNLTPESSKRPPRPPVSWEMLEILVKELNHEDPEDICVLACALAATSGQARLGEFLPTSMSTHDPSRHPSVSDLQPPTTAGGSRALKLPHTKTTGIAGDTIFLCSQNDCTDPNNVINKHLEINQLPLHYPLFSYRLRGGYAALTKQKFLKRCNMIWSQYDLPIFTGHCFRIGGTTILLLRGVSPYIVKAMGRWTSDAFLRYWRSLETLAPMHAEFLTPYVSSILPPKKTAKLAN